MKVLEPGRPQTGWAMEANCTGEGNGNGGCGARLLVEEDDLYATAHQSYGDTSPDYYNTFKCAACGVETDLPDRMVPSRVQQKIIAAYHAKRNR